MKEVKLDQMFATVRETQPEQSFRSTSRRYLKAKGVGIFGVALIFWGMLSHPLKIVIMISTLLTAGAITTAILLHSTPESAVAPVKKHQTEQLENKEIVVDEVGNTTITYFDDAKNVLRNETIPSRKQKAPTERMALLPIENLKGAPGTPKTRIPLQKTPKDSTENIKTFVIERDMLDTKLQEIQEKAIAAGIEFRYKMVVWKGKTKKISFTMGLKTEGTNCEYESELTGNFRKTIGWVEDGDGKAVRLLD